MPQNQYHKVRVVVQTVLESVSRTAGRESGFVQRASKVTAERFVQMLVLSCLERADAALEDMVEVGRDLGVEVTASGLDQRITDEAVRLLQCVLQALVAQSQRVTPAECAVLQSFAAVYLEDSTYLSLPEHLANCLRGSGGNASAAGAKVWLVYEYLSGTLHALEVMEGCCPDQACPLPAVAGGAGSLYLFDLGFYSLPRLQHIVEQKAYFVCRHHLQTAVYDGDGQRLDVEQWLQQFGGDQADLAVHLGAKRRLPVRLLCQRLPPSVVAKRQERARRDAQRMRRTLSPTKVRLLPWNIFLTNVSASTWSLEQALLTYRLRWQVELLFKLAKSQAGLDRCGPWRTPRVLCQLYAHLIALVLAQVLLGPLRFSAPRELSLPKAFAILQRLTPLLALAIAEGWRTFHTFYDRLSAHCRHALKDKRRRIPSTYSRLLAMNA
jgi:hypothetical protein